MKIFFRLKFIAGYIRDIFRIPIRLYYFLIFGKYSFKSTINIPLKIDGGKNILIGEDVFIGYRVWLSALSYTGSDECQLIIEDGVIIGHFNHIVATRGIKIEKNALLASRVYISDNQHDYSNPNIPIKNQRIIQKNNVVIGTGCWIGENVSIIGASIGKNSVIGANSVVTKSIPDYCIAVGIPARIIKRYNFETKTWERTND
jgi:acetyltransferase-like isoleucine patch superfamily enzyme